LKAVGFEAVKRDRVGVPPGAGELSVVLEFSRIGMVEKRTDSICLFDAKLTITGASGSSKQQIVVEGPVKSTVAASKNEAMRMFVRKVAEALASANGA
jgi:hypothetical protein